MRTSQHFLSFVCLINIVVYSRENYENSVKYYKRWITGKLKDIYRYEFPTDARNYEAEDTFPREYGEFDFIIVGAGSTGCVIANRLSEISLWKILVLEAGTYTDESVLDVPAWNTLNAYSKFNWGFRSVPQETAFLGNVDRRVVIPRGRAIGGTSLLSITYSRGHYKDYEKWSNLVNDTSWNYANLLPFFKKLEKFKKRNPYAPIDENYHGYNGEHYNSHSYPPQNVSSKILKGFQQLGYDIIDYNAKYETGSSIAQYFIKNGRRFDVGKAFIEPVKHRRNLKILENSYVTKIEISNYGKVKGVIFTHFNKTYIARSKKEVIISAGAISTPQILLLSGIGPKEDLEALGIPVVKNLPVGKRLFDHLISYQVFSSNIPSESNLTQSIKAFLKGQGALTSGLPHDALSFIKTKVERIPNYPDVEFMYSNMDETVKRFNGFSNETFQSLIRNVVNPFAIVSTLLHPKSVGKVTLKSANPFDYPLINLNYLSDKNNEDIETLYQATQIALELIKTKPFRSLNITYGYDPYPGCKHLEPFSRDYWYCYFRRVIAIGHHQTSTCSMGTGPENGVVNNKLEVFGFEGLRIADASVIPVPITGHTVVPCTVVGEKLSGFIKDMYT